jgi:hypothetical protein
VSDPAISSGLDPTVPSVALELSLTIEMPTDGVTATPPAAPICEVVVTLLVSEDVSERLFAPVSVAPLASCAVTESLTIATATATPTPTFPLVLVELLSGVGIACVVACSTSTAFIETFPPFAFTEAFPRISASTVSLTMLIATAPATPMFAPPLPAAAFAVKESLGGVFDPAIGVIVADKETPFADTIAPAPIVASLIAGS